MIQTLRIDPSKKERTMDRFAIEPQSFYAHQSRLLFRDQAPRRIDDMNLSELEVFMLRGRRLQARAMGDGFRQLLGKLRRLLHRTGHWPSRRRRHPDCHSAA